MKKILLSIILIIMILCVNTLSFALEEKIVTITYSHITEKYDCFKGATKASVPVIIYDDNGKFYPAYCIERNKEGAETLGDYTVKLREEAPKEEQWEPELWNGNFLNGAIWRIVTNGYPYLTPEEMGVTNEDEAYLSTKMALFRYMMRQSLEYYRTGEGAQDDAIYNAIGRLLEKAYNSDESYTEPNIENEKIGELEENEKFYVQEIKLNCNLKNKDLTVQANYEVENVGEGKYKVYIPRAEEEPIILLEVKCKMYSKPLYYGEASESNMQDYIVTTDGYEDFSKVIEVPIELPKLEEEIIIDEPVVLENKQEIIMDKPIQKILPKTGM